ncbi:MAG TPA: cytochrome c oxidase assembly factor Coa1 family protein [Edaphobacter sp.]|jgi:hypothetical protein|nr:cytochrome c oxidase assembly factor Coa1 family protein [Edaphobacter sp.]
MSRRLVGLLVLLLVLVLAGVSYRSFFEQSRGPVRMALGMASMSEVVSTRLGSDLRERFVTGRVTSGADSGNADLTIYVAGPKGHGTLHAWEQNGFAGWHICSLRFRDQMNRETVLVDDFLTHCERE